MRDFDLLGPESSAVTVVSVIVLSWMREPGQNMTIRGEQWVFPESRFHSRYLLRPSLRIELMYETR